MIGKVPDPENHAAKGLWTASVPRFAKSPGCAQGRVGLHFGTDSLRCYLFNVEPTQKAKGPRFRGRISVEDDEFTIVRMNGTYAPEVMFSPRHFEDEFYLRFDSWRTNSDPACGCQATSTPRICESLLQRVDRDSRRECICGAIASRR
jgi:hypothetical protein